MYLSVCISVFTFMLVLENVAGIICSTTVNSVIYRTNDLVALSYAPNNNGLEAVQNITCIHRYINVTGNQKNEIARHTLHNVSLQNITNRSFYITVERFDNNTDITCGTGIPTNKGIRTNAYFPTNTTLAEVGDVKFVYNFSRNSFNKTIIKVTNLTQTKHEKHTNLKYNETKNVTFSCHEHTNKTKYVQLGIIDTSNMIETTPETKMNQTFNITHNGTILCCIYYVLYEYNITRYVTNKTLLVYDDGNKIDQEDITKDTGNITNDANTNSDDTASGIYTKIYKIVAAVALTVFILLIVAVIWKRRCRKKTKSDHKVLYAELDHFRQTGPGTTARPNIQSRPNPEEESPYAQIIGVMRPNPEEEAPYANISGEIRPNPEEESPYANISGEIRPNPEEESPYANISGEIRPNPEEESPYAQIRPQ